MLRGLMKAEIARRVFNEARKPHNQAKIKSAVEQAKARRTKKR